MKDQKRLTRRQIIKTLGAGTAAATVSGALSKVGSTISSAAYGQSEPQTPTPRATAFNLTDVRLLESPFLQAQERDARSLLQLEPDRLLHNFRVNAGLTPKAPRSEERRVGK